LQLERGEKKIKEENNKPKRSGRMRVKTERKKKEERNRFLIFVCMKFSLLLKTGTKNYVSYPLLFSSS